MYQLGDLARSLPNLLFGLVGIWMAHTLYASRRPLWQIVAAWSVGLALCGVGASLLSAHFPSCTHERLSTLIGLVGIFVYLYLFTDIPIMQRVFTYFFVDNAMYILVIVSRYCTMYLLRWIPLAHDVLFLTLYILLLTLFICMFRFRLLPYMRAGLSIFRNSLFSLALFACVNYLSMLFTLDPYRPMGTLSTYDFSAAMLLVSSSVCSYFIAFYVMVTIQRASAAATRSTQLEALLCQSRARYEALHAQAVVDPLTGLYNRAEFERVAQERLGLCTHFCAAFLMLDLDDFKYINDTFGHNEGDQALRRFADALRNLSGPNDMVGRLGGDEFVLWLDGVTEERQVGEHMSALVQMIKPSAGDPYVLRASAGVVFTRPGDSFTTLCSLSDKALYGAKRSGKHRFEVYRR